MTEDLKTRRFNFSMNLSVGLASLGFLLLYHQWGMLVLLMFVICSVVLLIIYWSRRTALLYIGGAVIFPFIEILCVSAGIWQYTYSFDPLWNTGILLFGVPLWLFPLWGNVTVIIRRTDLKIRKE